MPVYDCGDPDCDECKRAFGPDRAKAINNYKRREAYYASLAGGNLAPAGFDSQKMGSADLRRKVPATNLKD